MKKNILKTLFLILSVLVINNNVNAETNQTEDVIAKTINVSNSEEFWEAYTTAGDGDVINVTEDFYIGYDNNKTTKQNVVITIDLNDHTLNTFNKDIDDKNLVVESDNFGINKGALVIFQNGTIDYLTFNTSSLGVVIINDFCVKYNLKLGNINSWILNGSYIGILYTEEGTVNNGISSLISKGKNEISWYHYDNNVDLLAGTTITNLSNKEFTSISFKDIGNVENNKVIFLTDYKLTSKVEVYAHKTNKYYLCNHTMYCYGNVFRFQVSQYRNAYIYSGRFLGVVMSGADSGTLTLSNVDFSDHVVGSGTKFVILSGHYNGGLLAFDNLEIKGGYFSGYIEDNLNLEITGGYFEYEPESEYIKTGYKKIYDSVIETSIFNDQNNIRYMEFEYEYKVVTEDTPNVTEVTSSKDESTNYDGTIINKTNVDSYILSISLGLNVLLIIIILILVFKNKKSKKKNK